MRLLSLIFFAHLCLLASPARAADIVFEKAPENETGVILIIGEIRPGDDERFREISLRLSSAVVVLESEGGSLLPALEIGKIIRVAGYDTRVLHESVCASSCALIWLAGKNREVMDLGRVGFHSAYRNNRGKLEEAGAANALIGNYLTSLGLPTRAILFATTAPPNGILWLTDVGTSSSGIEYDHIVSLPSTKENGATAIAPAPPLIETVDPVRPFSPTTDLLSMLSRSGEQWIKMWPFRNVYYDKSSLKKEKSKIEAWILYDFTNDLESQTSYEMKLTEADCKEGGYRINRTVTEDRDRPGLSRFSEPAPGSTERAVLKGLCSIK
jgi:hypothetical protein